MPPTRPSRSRAAPFLLLAAVLAGPHLTSADHRAAAYQAGEAVHTTGAEATEGSDRDDDGLHDRDDPCPDDARNRCFGPVAVDVTDGARLRIDAGAGTGGDERAVARRDCSGRAWLSDVGRTDGPLRRGCVQPRCRVGGVRSLFGCADPATVDLLSNRATARRRGGRLSYALDVADGRYLVNLFLARPARSGDRPAPKTVNVRIEGELVYVRHALKPARRRRAVVRSSVASVIDGVLDIRLRRRRRRAALHAIEIRAEAGAAGTTTTSTLATDITTTTVTTVTTVPPTCSRDFDCGDGDTCNGRERCVAGTCTSGVEPVCDDGLFCNGAETCDPVLGCRAGAAPRCGDATGCRAGMCDERVDRCVSASTCSDGERCDAATATCVTAGDDGDHDGLTGDADPCPADPRNHCFGAVATELGGGTAIRINAGIADAGCAGDRTDCTGTPWAAEFGANRDERAGVCNLAGAAGCAIAGLDALFGCSDEATADLLRCGHWGERTGPALAYAFAVADGSYLVNLFFANTFSGTSRIGDRTFDVIVEGRLVYDDFDQVAAAGGSGVAVVRSALATVEDGVLDITFGHERENPALKAIEVLTATAPTTTTTTLPECGARCADDVTASPDMITWGHVAVGEQSTPREIVIANRGTEPVDVRELAFRVGSGDGREFTATVAGVEYRGHQTDVAFALEQTIAPDDTMSVTAAFTPSAERTSDVSLVFSTDTRAHAVRLLGTGGDGPADVFLHVVIDTDELLVDHDGDGLETVELGGGESHTHEPGARLVEHVWTENGVEFARTADTARTLGLGEHDITLTIRDDTLPQKNLSDSTTIEVVTAAAVPGAIARYHAAGADGPGPLLDRPPALADFAEVIEGFEIAGGPGTIGGSPHDGNVLVRIEGAVELAASGSYRLAAHGGSATRLLVDGRLADDAMSLDAGRHTLDARFAVEVPDGQPLRVTIARAGGAPEAVDDAHVTHDQTGMAPVLNHAPARGHTLGGEQALLVGLGFFPADGVVVHWGDVALTGTDLDVKPGSIELYTPPGHGQVEVTVETPGGVSNPATFSYSASAPPIRFERADLAAQTGPTQAAWGPDGRLYVASLDGSIHAYTFDDSYRVMDVQVIGALRGSATPAILGLAFDPYEQADRFGIYVAHSRIFARGGSCNFAGPFEFPGTVSRISGPDLDEITPVITGLPTSNHDHAVNGMAFDDHGDLLIAVGGNTNAGVETCIFGGIPESPLSAAIVKAELSRPDFDGAVRYLDETTGSPTDDQRAGNDLEVASGVDVSVVAAGFRNSFDLAWTTTGRTYATDNGPDVNLGPASTGPDEAAPPPHPFGADSIDLVCEGGYHGHPNRNRGARDARQNVYRSLDDSDAGEDFTQALAALPSSTNGITEYRAATFGGAMRGQLVVQKWNGATHRLGMSADGDRVDAVAELPVALEALDVTAAPGGALIGTDFTDDRLVIVRPVETTLDDIVLHDIFPWRASTVGGARFVVSGSGFGSLADTSVTIDGRTAALTAVSAARIHGRVPARASVPGAMVDVVVTVGSRSHTLPAALRYLPARGVERGALATVTIDPGGTLVSSSTFTAGSFVVDNRSSGGQRIERVRVDLGSALLRDMVYDVDGRAGDPVGKPFTVDSAVGVTVSGHRLLGRHHEGFDVLEVDVEGFDPGRQVAFSIDVDPTSIRAAAAPGPGAAGSVSGLELTGATATVWFDDGTRHTAEMFAAVGSSTGARAVVGPVAPARPGLSMIGLEGTRGAVAGGDQIVTVTAAPGATVAVLVVEGALFAGTGGAFDVQPFEANSLVAAARHTAIVGPDGRADITVTLSRSGPEAGRNHLVAVVMGADQTTSRLSRPLIVDLLP